MKSWMWWVVGGVVLYFTRNTWMPWLGLGPGKLPEVAGSGTKSGSTYTQGGKFRPPPPSAGKA